MPNINAYSDFENLITALEAQLAELKRDASKGKKEANPFDYEWLKTDMKYFMSDRGASDGVLFRWFRNDCFDRAEMAVGNAFRTEAEAAAEYLRRVAFRALCKAAYESERGEGACENAFHWIELHDGCLRPCFVYRPLAGIPYLFKSTAAAQAAIGAIPDIGLLFTSSCEEEDEE